MSFAVMDPAASEELRDRVQMFLDQSDPRFRRISVEVDETAVQLTGEVDSYYLRSLALEAAMRVIAGVRVIDDQLTVTPPLRQFVSR